MRPQRSVKRRSRQSRADWQAQALYERIPRLPFMGVQPAVWFTGFSPDGLTLVSLDGNHVLTLWSVASRKLLKTYQFDQSLRSIHGSEDFSQWVALEGEQLVYVVLDTRERNMILGREYTSGSPWAVQGFVVNDTGTLLAIDKRWTQEELAEWEISERFRAETGASFGNAIVIWDLTQKRVKSLISPAAQRAGFGRLAFGPKSVDLFALDQNGDIVSFSVESGDLTRTFPTAMRGARLRLLPDKKHVLCFNDAQVKVISVASGKTVIDFPNPEGVITAVSLSLNLRLMAFGTGETVKIWNTEKAQPQRILQEGQGVTVRDVAFSPDGRWLAVASNRNRSPLGLWRLTQEEQSLAQSVNEDPEEATPEATHTPTPPPAQAPTPTEVQAVAVKDESEPSASVIPAVTGTAVPAYGSAAWNEMIQAARAKSKLLPVDEGLTDPGFSEFRAKLAQTVEKRDAVSLLAAVAEDVLNTTGEEKGKLAFRKRWKPEDSQSEVWRQLGDILRLGGRFNPAKTTFTAPFVYTELPPAPTDHVKEVGVILGKDVSLRSAPSAKSRLVEKRYHEIVMLLFGERPWFEDLDGGEDPWFGVPLPGGEMAYVSGRFLRCPLDYHARFRKMRTVWWLTEFACEWPRGE